MFRSVMILLLLFPLCLQADHRMMKLGQGQEIPQPDWFKDSFLELSDDLEEATDADKRLVLYYHQAGCPYCYNLITQVFKDPAIDALMQDNFDLIALNLWGDREITLPDGSVLTEKDLAVKLKIQYTPTLLFLDESGTPQLRIDGYRPPALFQQQVQSLLGHQAASAVIAQQSNETVDLSPMKQPIAIQFVSANCDHCVQFENDILKRNETINLLTRFNHLTVDLAQNPMLILPSGEKLPASDWVRQLGLSYFPSWLLLDNKGQERLRIDAYVRAFHFHAALEFVSEQRYVDMPEFQRYINERGDRFRAVGKTVNILD